jgi:peptide deformylase
MRTGNIFSMIRSLVRMGHPLLRQTARELSQKEILSLSIQDFIQEMHENMKHHGGIGLAAPQIGEAIQLAVIELEANKNRYSSSDELAFSVFINPKITILDSAMQGFWEGCLSVPGLRGYVERPRKVRVEYLNEKAEECVMEAEGFLATVLQHELDHLFGHLSIDRLQDTRLLSYQEEFMQFYGQTPDLDENV